MGYVVKEAFYTLQGEGANVGRPAVFCRFSGCNLWSGRESDRATAVCRFCDTDFVGVDGPGGGRFSSASALADHVDVLWPDAASEQKLIVLTGGEPALQVDVELIDMLHARGFMVAIETNGTVPLPVGIDWICVSPKAGAALAITVGDELKVVVPQRDLDLAMLGSLAFRHFYVQPLDGADAPSHMKYAIDWCMRNPAWRLSLQTHKIIGIR